ncbi:MAG: DUF3127 domain-containing protein [Prevotella sp.]|jgi:hypothetical protein|nr:DUF3127 domain-containing protein [Prevotella sp.]
MKAMILRVVKCGEMLSVKSEKSENGILNKRQLVLQELGGKYEPTYVVTALGNLATLEFSEGDIVIATLRFQTREFNGQIYMDIVATEMIKK